MGNPKSGSRTQGFFEGSIAGVNGAACMSVLREIASRADLVDATPPEVLGEALARRVALDRGGSIRHGVDHGVHFAVSLVAGGLYGAGWAHRRRPSFLSGIVFGAGVWAMSLLVFIPLLGRRRSDAHMDLPQAAINLAAHLAYGAVLPLLIQGMRADRGRRTFESDDRGVRVG